MHFWNQKQTLNPFRDKFKFGKVPNIGGYGMSTLVSMSQNIWTP